MSADLRINLVLATLGRVDEPSRFLKSLGDQTYRNFRLLVVDQNDDDRLVPLLAQYADAFSILRLHAARGLSRARNVALEHVEGEVVAFPDDDCWYGPKVLEHSAAFLAERLDCGALCGRAVDAEGHGAAGQRDRPQAPTPLTIFNLWARVASYTLFVRSDVVAAVGSFDERLGVGSGTPWGGGEDLDYVARIIRAGYSVHYDPSLEVFHPQKREQTSKPDADEGYQYGAGYGRALRQNALPRAFAVYSFARSVGAATLSMLRGEPQRARFYLAVARGRARGWRSAATR